MQSEKVFYLAHPIRGDEWFSEKDNVEHAFKVQDILWDAGLCIVNPWVSFVLLYPDEKDDLEPFMRVNEHVLGRLRAICLTGHRLSPGMKREVTTLANSGGEVLDLIGVPDSELKRCVHYYLGKTAVMPRHWNG